MNTRNQFLPRGFSLLEVLIAVAILAFGLLAITSLQASLVRNSAEAKSRSAALSVAKDRIEELRAYRTMDDYFALTDSVTPQSVTVGNYTFTVSTAVQRFGYNRASAAFEEIANDTAEDPGSDFVSENEFKRVSVSVGWTDSTGVAQSVVIEDAIGSVAPENTGKLARRNPDAAERKPVVLITDPSLDQGVIPIAIGDGSETAATNPRPEVDRGVQLQTSYDIFTFAALNDGSNNARAQSRVETAIIGCKCDRTEADSSAIDFRPTFWDGERYVEPDEATGYSVQAGEADLQNNDPIQSIFCSDCCRDHHDPSGVTGAKFSPRLDEHTHHLDDLTQEATGEYYEACRMIRVNGIFRVAADPYNEYTSLLKTAVASGETEAFTSPTPDSAAAENYEDFVVAYLEDQGDNVDPNTQLTQAEGDDLAEANGLDIEEQTVDVQDERWLHARGLYIDYLEPDAIDAISESQADCAEGLTESQCLLRVLPFTSINLTELATWTPVEDDDLAVYVANNDFVDSTLAEFGANTPQRGRVTGNVVGNTNAVATVRNSNTGLLANPEFHISLNDETVQSDNIGDQPDDDTQAFEITGPDCALLSTTQSIGSGNTATFVSSACEGSEAAKLDQTQIVLTLTKGSGPTNVTVTLQAPNGGTTYAVHSGTWASLPTTPIEIQATTVAAAGQWTLRVTNNDNGQPDSTTLAYSIEFRYTAKFTATITGYTAGTAVPEGSLDTGGSCTFSAASKTFANCNTTAPNVPTIWTLGAYNYPYTRGTNQAVTCPGSVSCNTKVGCKNFNITGVTNSKGAAGLVTDGVTGEGGTKESTKMAFSGGLQPGSIVTVTMAAGTDTTPMCTGLGPQCNKFTIACPE